MHHVDALKESTHVAALNVREEAEDFKSDEGDEEGDMRCSRAAAVTHFPLKWRQPQQVCSRSRPNHLPRPSLANSFLAGQ